MKYRSFLVFTILYSTLAMAQPFPEVWSTTQEKPYSNLPQYVPSRASFFYRSIDLLLGAANRTLKSKQDILPRFQKLVHPIGICFAGTWKIDRKSDYTGYFAEGSEGLIIVRASEAMGQPLASGWRALGFAGKIFPTTDWNETKNLRTANFFTVDDLGGADSKSFLTLAKTNEPKVSLHFSSLSFIPTILAIKKAFERADSHPTRRDLYPISELGLADKSKAKTPFWMSIVAETKPLEDPPADFRQELQVKLYPDEKLVFGIHVAEKGQENWTRLGEIVLTKQTRSEGCDHRLHFPHPRSKVVKK